MRTNTDMSEQQPSRSYQRPEPRYREVNGKTVPLYECRYCRDQGLISMPAPRPNETDADLIGAHGESCLYGVVTGKRYTSYCPNCRGIGNSTRPGADLSAQQRGRLARWYRAMTEAFGEGAAREVVLDGRSGRPFPDLNRIAKPLPQLTEFEQNEIAAQMRREAQA